MEDEKPNKRGRKAGSKNKVEGKIVGEHKKIGRDNKHLKANQGKSRKEFLKVLPGETQEQWEKRTQKKAIFGRSSDSLIKGTKAGKLVLISRKLYGEEKEVQLRITRNLHERPFEFLKVYPLIMRWAEVRYSVLKDDIEIGFYFYDGRPFTKEEFNALCSMTGYVKQVFSRFYKNGYIQRMAIMNDLGKTKNTQYYILTIEFTAMIRKVYGAITKTSKMIVDKHKPKPNAELIKWILEMNTDIEETLEGLKKPDKITYRNDKMD